MHLEKVMISDYLIPRSNFYILKLLCHALPKKMNYDVNQIPSLENYITLISCFFFFRYSTALEDTRSRHRRSQHHFVHNTRSADEKVSIAINPVIKLAPNEDEAQSCVNKIIETVSQHQPPEKYTFTLNSIKILQDTEVSNTDSTTPISSDAEQTHNSPRRTCIRKRKERRDSIGDGQDHKLCKSSR